MSFDIIVENLRKENASLKEQVVKLENQIAAFNNNTRNVMPNNCGLVNCEECDYGIMTSGCGTFGEDGEDLDVTLYDDCIYLCKPACKKAYFEKHNISKEDEE
jgi:hypothetical protein